ELEEPYFIFNNEILVRFRMGISFQKKEYLRAEMALNKAKELKKDIVFGSDAIENKENYGEHIKWLKKLKNAIDNDRIVPFFQPIYDKNEKIVKYEALVRMIDEDGKVISPFFFLDVAKKSRLYLEITKIMLSKSLRTIRDNKVSISINITLEDMEDEEMREFIIKKIDECIYKDKVTFEIVENEDIRESEIIKEFLDSLRAKGVSLYIDDFGSGYANFDYLLKLHPEGVKIDGSLIKNILNDKNSQVMVKTLINFAKESEIFIVAEFVENREIFEMLRDMGVDYFQGYYFSPPKPDIER
ncbi:EAL domain-containing protein, partial [Caminibacter pacificus]